VIVLRELDDDAQQIDVEYARDERRERVRPRLTSHINTATSRSSPSSQRHGPPSLQRTATAGIERRVCIVSA
jgi:hypothetical protein